MAGVEIPKLHLPSMGRQSRIQKDFEFLKWLGKGAFGDVRKMRKKLDCCIYAIKRIKLNPKEKMLNKNITREVKLLSRMNHENVVRYYNSWIGSATLDDQFMPITTTSSDRTTTTQDKADIVNQLESDETGKFSSLLHDVEWNTSYESRANVTDSDDENCDALTDSDSEEHCASIKSFDSIEFESDGISQKFAMMDVSNNDVRDTETEDSEDVKKIQCLYIQMEFCENTLSTAINNDLYKDEERVWRLFREIAEGLAYIHQQGMIHRDLKPVNIFLDSNDHVKIGDFGLARPNIDADKESQFEKGGSFDVDELGSLTGHVGTPLYVAPEISAKTTKAIYNQKVDIYSLGIIFFEMTYKPLATRMKRNMILLSLRLKKIVFPPDIIETDMVSQVHIIRWLLNHDPSQRPTAQELLSSPYLPPLKLEEPDLSALMRHTLSNSQNSNNNEPQGNDGNKLPQFPIVTVQELENFNKLLQEDATARAQYEKKIKNFIGEKDVKKHVQRALILILSDEFSCKLSWTGQKKTIKVKDMKFVDIMIESMINSGRNCTISDVQDIIKKWLQRASDRVRYKKKKHAQT